MEQAALRRRRMEKLLNLAQAYRGWSRRELARSLKRDATRLVPDSGVPKLDLVVDLAEIMDWPIDMVVKALCHGDVSGIDQAGICGDFSIANDSEPEHSADTVFDELDEQAKAAHREGRYGEMIELARRAYGHASTAEQRAIACNREAGGWDGLGRYANMLEAVQRGMRENNVSSNRRLMLQVNLANAYYTLWQLVEARATARDLLERFEFQPPNDRLTRVVQAFAHYVRGNCHRRLMRIEPDDRRFHAEQALEDLSTARALYLALAEEFDDQSYSGVANTCYGGLLEVEVELGTRSAEDVLRELSDGLDPLIDPKEYPVGDWLESFGWWCIFACNIALHHVDDEKSLQQHMAIFTNKADELASHLDNWAMRERVFTMELERRQRLSDWTGLDPDWMIDSEDIRVIAGTMGRFPGFQRTGWRILETAKVIQEN